ncbi:MAG: GDSL-type esterase/lipase family protein [Patescibacteria group bacterium]
MTAPKLFLGAVGILIAFVCVYWGVRFLYLLNASKKLVAAAVPYEHLTADTSVSMLVLGDSTAVGVGASTSTESLPGLVAHFTGATYVENHAVSGAVVSDLAGQIGKAELTRYDLILVQIGANDIVRFHDARETAERLSKVLGTLPQAEHVVVLSAGDVGAATLFPEPIRPFYTRLNQGFHQEFSRALAAQGITYVNLSTGPGVELFIEQPNVYLAADGFHPSSAGYGLWFEAVRSYLKANK